MCEWAGDGVSLKRRFEGRLSTPWSLKATPRQQMMATTAGATADVGASTPVTTGSSNAVGVAVTTSMASRAPPLGLATATAAATGESRTDKTPINLLQELCTKRGITPQYDLLNMEGPVHEPTFIYRVTVGELCANGQGASKKNAKHGAAQNALDKISGNPESCPVVPSSNSSGGDSGSAVVCATGKGGGSNEHAPANGGEGTSALPPDGISGDSVDSVTAGGNPIGTLQEMTMERRWPPPLYELVTERGQPHEREFHLSVCVAKYKLQGTGRSKKLAKRQAAQMMVNYLRSLPPPDVTKTDQTDGQQVDDIDEDSLLNLNSNLANGKMDDAFANGGKKSNELPTSKQLPGDVIGVGEDRSQPSQLPGDMSGAGEDRSQPSQLPGDVIGQDGSQPSQPPRDVIGAGEDRSQPLQLPGDVSGAGEDRSQPSQLPGDVSGAGEDRSQPSQLPGDVIGQDGSQPSQPPRDVIGAGENGSPPSAAVISRTMASDGNFTDTSSGGYLMEREQDHTEWSSLCSGDSPDPNSDSVASRTRAGSRRRTNR